MTPRRKRALLAAALAPVIALPAFVGWVAGTESGLQWLAARAVAFAPGEIRYAQLSGQLNESVALDGFSYRIGGTYVQAQHIELEWRPSELLRNVAHIARLKVSGLSIDLPPAQARPADTPLQLPDIRLPFLFRLEDILLEGIRITRAERTLLELDTVTLDALADADDLEIIALTVQAPNYQGRVTGELQPQGHYRHDLALEWQVAHPDYPVFIGVGRLRGDLRQTRLTQEIGGPLDARLDAVLADLTGHPRWTGDIEVNGFSAQTIRRDWPAIAGALKAHGQGDLATLSAEGSFKGSIPVLGANEGEFRLDWHPLRGLTIAGLELRVAATGTRLNLAGQWLPGKDFGQASATLSWQNAVWPLAGTPWMNSQAATLRIEGAPGAYRYALEGDLAGPEIPPGLWRLEGNGTLQSLTFARARVDTLGGTIEGSGELRWRQPGLAWEASLAASALDPGQILAQWPGALDFRLASSGRFNGAGLEGELTIEDISGTLRGLPFRGNASLGARAGVIDVRQLALRSGESSVSLQGRYGPEIDFKYDIQSIELSDLYPDIHGALTAAGTLTGPRATPRLSLDAQGRNLRHRQYGIERLQARLKTDLLRWNSVEGDIRAGGLDLAGKRIDAAHVQVSGTGVSHELSLSLDAYKTSLRLDAIGGLNQSIWEGRVTRADISNQVMGDWSLRQSVGISAGTQTLSIPGACWISGEATACLDLAREPGRLAGAWRVTALPLAYLSHFLPKDIAFAGFASLSGSASREDGGPWQGQTELRLPPGAIFHPLPEGEYGSWNYQGGVLSARLDGEGLISKLRLTLQQDDELDAEASLPGFDPLSFDPAAQPLHAGARLRLRNLGLVESLVPEIQDIQGSIDAELKADGTLAQPRYSVQANLNDGRLRIPRLGLSITGLGIEAGNGQSDTLNYRLSARSGDGTLRLQGKTLLSPGQGWPSEIAIQGENVEVSRIPEARVVVSPDLAIRTRRREIHVEGEIRVPQARIQPRDVSRAVSVSDDLVLAESPEAAPEKWQIHTRIRLALGDRIHFYGYGFEGRIGGNLLLTDKPRALTMASGELTVEEGRYRAYGQRLEVERGRILYAGGPLTNPGLDIQAVRRVEEVVAGIRVRGTLRTPRLELYSIPAMGETDALSYLVLGRPFEQSTTATGEDGALMAQAALALSLKGGDMLARSLGDRFGMDEMRIEASDSGEQASLVIGRYLSPKLYVSYGVGLIEAVNTINLRYQISRRWQLKAESGTYQQADLLYTIEK